MIIFLPTITMVWVAQLVSTLPCSSGRVSVGSNGSIVNITEWIITTKEHIILMTQQIESMTEVSSQTLSHDRCFHMLFSFTFFHKEFLLEFYSQIKVGITSQLRAVKFNKYPRSLNVSNILFFTNCLGVVFSCTLHLARGRLAK
mgnify:CR=1 FL=1